MRILVTDQSFELVIECVTVSVESLDFGLARVVFQEGKVELLVTLSCDHLVGNLDLVLDLLILFVSERADTVLEVLLVLLNGDCYGMMLIRWW